MTKQATLEELLKEKTAAVSDFAKAWINHCRATEQDLRTNFIFLSALGLSDDKIASRAELLGLHPDTVQRNYESLKRLGLSDDKIASRAELLGRDPDTVQRNYESLKRLGLSDDLIRKYAFLLGQSTETVRASIKFCERVGIDYAIQPLVLETRTKRKIAKLRTFFKEIFDEEVSESTIEERAREFYAHHEKSQDITTTLVRSENYMRNNKDKLRERYHS